MKSISILLFLLLLIISCKIFSQPYFPDGGHVYTDAVVPRIDAYMDTDSFEIMYNDLYTETEYTAKFVFNDGTTIDTVNNIGIRVRGNTSQVSQKKSFKISFNTFVTGRKFYGEEKLHLNGEHNDPSIIRSKLYWETLESMQVPGPRANHVDFYINGNYFGLYINVENIDEQMLESRFGNNNGNLYKCLYPADLNYISSYADDYKFEVNGRRAYDLQTNKDEDDYSDLANFISILNNTEDAQLPVALEKVFNINSFLRAYTVDVATGNWDDYSYNQNNFYLYHNPATGKFEYIPYDTDNTFGIDWFGIDWGTRDIYSWYNNSLNISLVKRIFGIQEYVDRYTFFMNELNQGLGDTTNIFPIIDSILPKIKSSAQADTYRTLDYGWSYNDFLNSYTIALGAHVKYGLKPFFTTRHDQTNNQLQTVDVIPIISNLNYAPKIVHANDSVFISAWVEDELTLSSVMLNYKFNSSSINSVTMFDDGLHSDGSPNDQVYGVGIIAPNIFDTIFYSVEATDINSQTGREPRENFYSTVVVPIPHLVFNEVMASNTTAVSDEFGEYDDWVEIYNADSFSVSLNDKYLSDEKNNSDKWRLPDVEIPAHSFVLIWCDEQTSQGKFHASFKLKASGEHIFLNEVQGTSSLLLDSVAWENQITDVSIGCFPNGVLPIITLEAPTPGYSNLNIGIEEHDSSFLFVAVYPNPFSENLILNLVVSSSQKIQFQLLDVVGRNTFSQSVSATEGNNQFTISKNTLRNLTTGVYFLKVSSMNDSKVSSFHKIIKQ